MQIVDVGLVGGVLARDEIVDHAGLKRARAEQGNECHKIVKLVRAHAFYQISHATGFKLKYGGRPGAA